MTRIERSRAPRGTLSLSTRRRSLNPAMSGLIEAVELRDAATDVKETETETGDEEEKRVSKIASAMSRGGTIRLAAAGLAMSLRCAMFDAWAMSCLTGRSSSPRGT